MTLLKIAVLGEIGSGNLGDDLGFVIVRDLLIDKLRKHGFECHINCYPPARFSSLDHEGPNLVVTGCGTLLDHQRGSYIRCLQLMQARTVFTSILGSGISDPNHLVPDPPAEEGGEPVKTPFINMVERAISPWIRGQSGPDPFWHLGYHPPSARSEVVGFNMGYAAYTEGDINSIWSRIQSVKKHLEVKGVPTTFVSCWPNDNSWYEPGDKVLQVGCSRKSLEELHKLKCIVSFRGHLGVAAACYGIPVYPVIFSTKVEDMYRGTDVSYTPLRIKEDDWSGTVLRTFQQGVNNKEAVEKAAGEVENKVDKAVDDFLRLRAQRGY